MAVLNDKKIAQLYKEHRLPPSARVLLKALATCTDESGWGRPTWNGLMYFSGIRGKDTLGKALKLLKNIGVIDSLKEFTSVNEKGKKMPRARVYYQLSETILLKKRKIEKDKTQNNSPFHGMASESMKTGNEGVSFIGVNNTSGVIKTEPSAVNKSITKEYKTFEEKKYPPRGGNPTSIGETLGRSTSKLLELTELQSNSNYEWQIHAERIAERLKIDVLGDKIWFDFFKVIYKKNKQHLLDAALTAVADYPNPKDIKGLFFWKVNTML